MVSIIVPIYNVEEYLCQCIDSILTQTYRDLEVILVDDGSTDGSGSICDEYGACDSRVKVIHKSNGGLTSARNAGLDIAKGKWVMHIDGDDFIDPEMVETLEEESERTGADLVICGMRLFWDNSKEQKNIRPIVWSENRAESLANYIKQSWTCLCGSMAKRELYTNNNLRSPLGITWQEDFYLMVRLAYYATKPISVNRQFYWYRQRSTSIMGKWSEKMENSAIWVFDETITFLKAKSSEIYAASKEVLAWRQLNVLQGRILSKKDYDIMEKVSGENRRYIFSCPSLTVKRKILYFFHSFGIVRLLGLYRNNG